MEEYHVNLSMVARMFSQKPRTFYCWYKNNISDYVPDKENGKWCSEKIEVVTKQTGEMKEKPVYILKEKHLGTNMSIDDKAISHEGFTILSNSDTGKIAMMIESTSANEIEEAMKKMEELDKIKSISMDMSSTYAKIMNDMPPQTEHEIDKFHAMKYVYECVVDIRRRIRKELSSELTKGKKRTASDKKKLKQIDQLCRVSHAIIQSSDKWSDEMKETVNKVFSNHEKLRIAYEISQNF